MVTAIHRSNQNVSGLTSVKSCDRDHFVTGCKFSSTSHRIHMPQRLPDVANPIVPHITEGISGWSTCRNPYFSELGQLRQDVVVWVYGGNLFGWSFGSVYINCTFLQCHIGGAFICIVTWCKFKILSTVSKPLSCPASTIQPSMDWIPVTTESVHVYCSSMTMKSEN